MVSSDPILNSPLGITTISEHSGQSRKISPSSGTAAAGAAGREFAAGGGGFGRDGVRGAWLSEVVAQKAADAPTRRPAIRKRKFISIPFAPVEFPE
jgi:hypothetical protein